MSLFTPLAGPFDILSLVIPAVCVYAVVTREIQVIVFQRVVGSGFWDSGELLGMTVAAACVAVPRSVCCVVTATEIENEGVWAARSLLSIEIKRAMANAKP